MTLPVDGFLMGEGQSAHLAVKLKEGQTVTIYGGNDVAQNRYLDADETYHVADYYPIHKVRSLSTPSKRCPQSGCFSLLMAYFPD